MIYKVGPNILNRILSYDDLDWAGVRTFFKTFYEKVRAIMEQDEILSKDIDEHLNEINEYIMIRLNKSIFSNKIQSKHEYEIYCKM